MSVAVNGVESIELAPIGVNGAMPTSGWVKLRDLEMSSVVFTVPEPSQTNIRVEDRAGVRWVLPGDTDPATFAANTLDINIDNANLLFKGQVTSGETEFKAPTVDNIYYLAIRFTSKPFENQKFVLEIPVAAISAAWPNPFTKDGMVGISMKGTATTPVDAAGETVSPWGYKFIPATT